MATVKKKVINLLSKKVKKFHFFARLTRQKCDKMLNIDMIFNFFCVCVIQTCWVGVPFNCTASMARFFTPCATQKNYYHTTRFSLFLSFKRITQIDIDKMKHFHVQNLIRIYIQCVCLCVGGLVFVTRASTNIDTLTVFVLYYQANNLIIIE